MFIFYKKEKKKTYCIYYIYIPKSSNSSQFVNPISLQGAVSVRFFLQETSFCIVCSHLASGGKEGDELHRNSNAMEILSRTSFPRGPSLDLPQNILDHEYVNFNVVT